MRVLHIDHSGLPGGGQLGLVRYAEQSSNHSRSYFFLTGGPAQATISELGDPCRVSGLGSPSLGNMIRNRSLLRREIAEADPELVVANSFRAAVAVALAKANVPSVYYLRQDMTVASTGIAASVFARGIVFQHFDGFIANSEWTLGTLPRELRSRPAGIAYPLSGITEDGEARLGQYATGGVSDSDAALRLLWLGRIAPWKGLDIVLDSLERIETRRQVLLTVAGSPIHEGQSYLTKIHRKGAASSHRVEFKGHVDDVRALLANHDVLIHSSIRPEPFGQVVLQGMAAGLPVIASAGGGPSEIITHDVDGLLVPPRDSQALAQAITRLDRGHYLRRRLGAAAKERSAEFQDAHLAGRLDEVLSDLAKRVG